MELAQGDQLPFPGPNWGEKPGSQSETFRQVRQAVIDAIVDGGHSASLALDRARFWMECWLAGHNWLQFGLSLAQGGTRVPIVLTIPWVKASRYLRS